MRQMRKDLGIQRYLSATERFIKKTKWTKRSLEVTAAFPRKTLLRKGGDTDLEAVCWHDYT